MTSIAIPQPNFLLKMAYKLVPNAASKIVVAYARVFPEKWQSQYNHSCGYALDRVGFKNKKIKKDVFKLPSQFIADTLFFSLAEIKSIQAVPIKIINPALHSHDPRNGKRIGVVIACANFSCFYYVFLARPAWLSEVLIISSNVPNQSDKILCEKLELISGVRISIVEASTSSAVTISRCLKRGGVIATMLDSYLPNTASFKVPFMGYPAAIPKGIYEITERFSALIIPAYCLNNGKWKSVYFDSPIDTTGMSAITIAQEVNAHFERVINDYPNQWMMWSLLAQRWHEDKADSSTKCNFD